MKKVFCLILALALLLVSAAFAEDTDLVQGIYETMTAEDSGYSQIKNTYLEYYPGVKFEESLDGDSFTIAASGSEYMTGTWTFVREGDYLTLTIASDDYSGMSMAMYVLQAVGQYYGMNTSLLNGYLAGLQELDLDNPYYKFEGTEDTVTYSIYIAGAYDMAGLDDMYLTEEVLEDYMMESLTEDYTSTVANVGKISFLLNGNKDEATILLGEYGELDDLAYQSLINAVSVLQPAGWESFVESYTELTDAAADGYTVTINADEAAVQEIYPQPFEGYSYAIVTFGGSAE